VVRVGRHKLLEYGALLGEPARRATLGSGAGWPAAGWPPQLFDVEAEPLA
jgi:hypothetical protein